MKTLILLLSLFPAFGFLSQQTPFRSRTLVQMGAREREEIAHELEDLGDEIKDQVMKRPEGFSEFHEEKLHELKREMRQKDEQWHKALMELQHDVKRIEQRLYDTQKEFRLEKIEYEVEEKELLKEIKHFEEEQENVRALLGDAFRLMGRRTKNGIGNGTNAVLRFLRLKKKKEE